jgi:signal transduction histidine kinase
MQAQLQLEKILRGFKEREAPELASEENPDPRRVAYLGDSEDFTELRSELWRVRGLFSKARRVIFNAGLFSILARGEKVEIKKVSIPGHELYKRLVESAQDNQLLEESGDPSSERRGRKWGAEVRRVTFRVHREGFQRAISVDLPLFEQAISCVLDNAFKYSFNNTQVEVTGRITGRERRRLAISFLNEGIPIEAEDREKCKERGWQGEVAKSVNEAGRGAGIGLWIVDHIMKAHGGELKIHHKGELTAGAKGRKKLDSMTEVELHFPLQGD